MDPNLGLARETPHLMTLPQEMLDMIFALAYTRSESIPIISSKAWEKGAREGQRGNGSWIPRPFPETKVQEFLVSKEFFSNAAKAFMHNNIIRATDRYTLAPVETLWQVLSGGIARAWLRNLYTRYSTLPIPLLGNVKSLTIGVDPYCFQATPLRPWNDEFQEEHILREHLIPRLLELRGFSYFSLHIDTMDDHRIDTPERLQCWRRNMERLGSLIRSRVLQPKTANSGIDRPASMHGTTAL
ncbi:hypothetical protein LTR10_009986 [Elasticomyces elasticus]|nr:hypothetical protein LTR10_009986 [Elasticomyces elasticus]KAK4970278.1 hypothetical protein LTR42_008445 [Elasticomyces elasticus]